MYNNTLGLNTSQVSLAQRVDLTQGTTMSCPRLPKWAAELMTPKERKDDRAARALANGKSPTTAASLAGMSYATFYRRKVHLRAQKLRDEQAKKSRDLKAG